MTELPVQSSQWNPVEKVPGRKKQGKRSRKANLLILVLGLPGTGKTTLAKALEQSIRPVPVHLSTDVLRKQLFSGWEENIFSSNHEESVYRAMFYIIDVLLDRGVPVIADGTFYREEKRQQACKLAEGRAELKIIHVTCPGEVIRERIEARINKEDPYYTANHAVHLKMKEKFEPVKLPHLVVNSEKNIEEQVGEVKTYLKTA